MKNLNLFLTILMALTFQKIFSMQSKTSTASQTDHSSFCINPFRPCTPLVAACWDCFYCLYIFIQNDPDIVNQTCEQGFSLLHYLTRDNKVKSMAILIEYGAHINKICGGFSPLHKAAEHGNIAAIDLLLQNGADIDATCSTPKYLDYTALCIAIENNHPLCVELLIKNGANTVAAALVARKYNFNLASIIQQYRPLVITRPSRHPSPKPSGSPNDRLTQSQPILSRPPSDWDLVSPTTPDDKRAQTERRFPINATSTEIAQAAAATITTGLTNAATGMANAFSTLRKSLQ